MKLVKAKHLKPGKRVVIEGAVSQVIKKVTHEPVLGEAIVQLEFEPGGSVQSIRCFGSDGFAVLEGFRPEGRAAYDEFVDQTDDLTSRATSLIAQYRNDADNPARKSALEAVLMKLREKLDAIV